MTINTAEEKSLVQALQLGDHRAFEKLYNNYSNKLYWKLIRMLKDENEADELLQELFVKVWEKREQINEEYSFGAFLTGIAKNMVVDFYRKLARAKAAEKELSLTNSELTENTEETLISNETALLLKRAIEQLPEQRRIAFKLCKVEGKSHKEAAEIMQISPNTVHNHLVKATQNVREFMQSQHLANPVSILIVLASII